MEPSGPRLGQRTQHDLGRSVRRLTLGGLLAAWAGFGLLALSMPQDPGVTVWILLSCCALGALIAVALWRWATSPVSAEQITGRADFARPVLVAIVALECVAILLSLIKLGWLGSAPL
jgi:hypothetical protein